jgi:hypothetical protein
MNLFQVAEVDDVLLNNSGNKVVADISTIAAKNGFERIKMHNHNTTKSVIDRLKRKIDYILDWKKCYKQVTNNSIILLQHPVHIINAEVVRKLKYKKNIRFISVVIDVEELRQFYFNKFHKKEFELMLETADILIVHNDMMTKFFLEKGFPKEKIINIETFDYLQENNNIVNFEKSISFAGNLDTVKCGFIGHLKELKAIKVNLYGSNLDENLLKAENLKYYGSFPVDEIPKKINKGFGLVWDGDSIDTCSGSFGQYLKYNNPHKLSLYLSCGLPVVIWKQAAQANFVKKYKLGICVDSLREAEQIISNMDENNYKEIQSSVDKLKPLLCSGYFADKAIKKALKLLK